VNPFDEPLASQIVGSYTKPPWLVNGNQARRLRRFDPAAYWAPSPEVLPSAQQDAARLAILEQERAGMRVVTDGEAFRHAYDTAFLLRMTGIDFTSQGSREVPRSEVPEHVRKPRSAEEDEELSSPPRITGPVSMADQRTTEEVAFAKGIASRPLKAAVVGPFTALHRLANSYYPSDREAMLAIAAALNAELLSLERAGADVLQLDEPALHHYLSGARDGIIDAINTAVKGLSVPVVIHVCYGYPLYMTTTRPSSLYTEVLSLVAQSDISAISLAYEVPRHEPQLLKHCGDKHILIGMVNLASKEIESPHYIETRLREAAAIVPIERLHPSVDCGMWFLDRATAYQKLQSLATAADNLRSSLNLQPQQTQSPHSLLQT
jgi:5-methyltetrahydropteroyltriglutamate--homocysteine methyltransferase